MRALASKRGRALAATGLVAGAAYLLAQALDQPDVRPFVKPWPVLCLAAALAPWRLRAARLVAAGLVASAVGDVLLELPGRFVLGMLAFGLAHVAYALAFVGEQRELRPARLLPLALWVVALWALLRPGLGGLVWPVGIYAAVIGVMMWRASALLGSPAGHWAGVGAVLFGASDSLIALDRFHAPIAGVRVPIMLLYWAGQIGIARWAMLSGHRRAGA